MGNEKKLVERLNFKESDVFLDGNRILRVQGGGSTETDINLIGISGDENVIYVGTGQCCYGYIQRLINSNKDGKTPEFKQSMVRVPSFNVYDMIPTRVDYEKTGFTNPEAILTTGFGCAGSGVQLISTHFPRTIEVVSNEEFQKMKGRSNLTPRLRVDAEQGTIALDLIEYGFRLEPGKTRDPDLPSLLVDKDEKYFTSQDIDNSLDLGPRLKEIGIKMDETIEDNKGYVRIR